MKKYFAPQMEMELFDGRDLFTEASPGVHGGQTTEPPIKCPDDDWAPAPCFNITWSGDEGPGI